MKANVALCLLYDKLNALESVTPAFVSGEKQTNITEIADTCQHTALDLELILFIY